MRKTHIKTPITYYGGKQSMLPHLREIAPEHKGYTESFAGGLAYLFDKKPSKFEVINDTNGAVVNFYVQFKENFSELNKMVQSTLHSRKCYQDAKVIYENPHLFDEVTRAWSFWLLTNQGFASKIGSWGYDRSSGGIEKRNYNKKLLFIEDIAARLDRVQIECGDAIKVIQSRDTPSTYHYVDPPYVSSNQGHYGGYTVDDFERLLQCLASIQGKFVLSSYNEPILEQYSRKYGWTNFRYEKQLSASKCGTKRKVEVLTVNYDPGLFG
jgi:DNA adenine methylase